MLLVVAILAFLIVPCSSQTGLMGPIIGISPPPRCRQDDSTQKHSVVREALFQYFNNLRSKFAEGEDMFPNVKYQRGARMMYAMRYDCGLEQKAFTALGQALNRIDDYIVVNYDRSVDSGLDLIVHLVTALDYWKTNHGEAKSTLMYPYVPFFGCAHSYDANSGSPLLKLTCVFDKQTFGFFNDGPEPCKQNDDCKRYISSECKNSLCWAPERSFTLQ